MFQYCKNNSREHELLKFAVFVYLIEKGYEVLCEPEFKDGGRADLIFFDIKGNGNIIEILRTEAKESVTKKINYYPLDFELHTLSTQNPTDITF